MTDLNGSLLEKRSGYRKGQHKIIFLHYTAASHAEIRFATVTYSPNLELVFVHIQIKRPRSLASGNTKKSMSLVVVVTGYMRQSRCVNVL